MKTVPELKTLIEIGNEAVKGLICNHCGRKFRKATGMKRTCKTCKRNEE